MEADLDHFCRVFVVFFLPNIAVTNLMVSLISLNGLLAILEKAEEYFTWKKCGAYYLGFWIISFIVLSFPLSNTWGDVVYANRTFSCTIEPHGPYTFFAAIGELMFVMFPGVS